MSTDAILGAIATVLAALIAIAGAAYAGHQARLVRAQQNDAKQRELNLDELTAIQAGQNLRITDLERRLEKAEAGVTVLKDKLRRTWRYVQTLRSAMREHRCDPEIPLVIPPIPEELATIPWDTLD